MSPPVSEDTLYDLVAELDVALQMIAEIVSPGCHFRIPTDPAARRRSFAELYARVRARCDRATILERLLDRGAVAEVAS